MRYKSGDIVEVRVINCLRVGAVCEIGREKCFIHISQFANYYVSDVSNFVKVGDILKVEVMGYNPERRHYLLSYKSIREVPDATNAPLAT